MRFLVWVVVLVWGFAAGAGDDPFAFTPPPEAGMIETPFGPAPAIRDWPKDKPQALVDGMTAHHAGNYDTARKRFVPLAEAGHAVAMNYIGRMYSDALGVGKDRKFACDWYERSSEGGYKSGQFNFGTCYLIGSGRSEDLDQAGRWLWPAAEAGDKLSRYKLAAVYGLKGDRENDIYWLKKLAESGSKDAAFGLYGFGVELPDFGWLDYACVWYSIETGKPLGYCDD